jgi:F-type H+-transporting ATPase subunit b
MRCKLCLCSVGLFALAFMVAAGGVRAAGAAGQIVEPIEEHNKHSTKVETMIHVEGGGEELRTFDLANPEELRILTELLKKGEVEEMKKIKPVNIFAITWDLGLWTVVVFLLLLFILRKLAWEPMLTGLQKREDSIKSALEEAKRSSEESQKLRGQMASQMAEAQEKVKAVLDNARRDAQSMADDLVSKAKSEILADRQRLHREVDLARDQALEALSVHTAELATLVASKALGRGVVLEDQHRLIEEAIAGLASVSPIGHKAGM